MITTNSLFVDTSGWVSLLGADERLHAEVAAVYADSIQLKRGLVTTTYVLTEVVALLTARAVVPRQRMFAFIDAPHPQRTSRLSSSISTPIRLRGRC